MSGSEVSLPVPEGLWQELYDADADALPSQSPQWLSALRADSGYRDASKLFCFPTGRRVLVPMAERRIAGVGLAAAAWPSNWNYGGLLVEGGGPPTAQEATAVLADLARGFAPTRLAPDPREAHLWDKVAGPSILRVPQRTHALDLCDGFDALWSDKFTRTTRQHVRVAEKRGVEVIVDRSEEAIKAFSSLYNLARLRWGHQRGHPTWLTRLMALQHDPVAQARKVLANCGDEAVLWRAMWRGQPVAAHIVLTHGNTVHDWLGAVDHDLAKQSHGTYLLESRLLQAACEDGRQWVNLGESDPGGSVEEHKRRLGALPIDYPVMHIERVPVTATVLRVRSAAVAFLAGRKAKAIDRERINEAAL